MNEQGIIIEVTLGGYMQFYWELLVPLLCLGIHYGKRRFFWLRALLCLAAGVPLYWMNIPSALGINFNYIVCFALTAGAAFFLYKERPSVAVLSAVAAFGLQHLAWNLIGIAFDLMPHLAYFERWSISLTYYLVMAGIDAAYALLFFKAPLRLHDNRAKPIVYFLGAIIIFITWLLSQWVQEWNIFIRLYTVLATLLALVCLFLFPALIKGTEDAMRLRGEKDILENLIEQQSRQNETSEELREIMRIHIHDLRHELDAIETYSEEEKKGYIAKVRADLDLYQGFAKTGNKAVDVILTEKSLLSQRKGIRFNYIVDGEALSFLPKSDMVSLLGNLLDNAIEAASKEEDENRIIKFHVYQSSGMLCLECVNYAHALKSFSIEDYSSSKPLDGQFHGYGIKSMKYIAKRYGGSVDASLKDAIFTIRVILPRVTK